MREFNAGFVLRSQCSSHEARKVSNEMRRGKLRSEKGWSLRLGGGEEKVDSFRDGEEVAARGRIGNGEWKVARDLTGEDLRDAAARCENIAEAKYSSSRSEHNLFGDALGGSHHGRGSDGFVGRKQDDASVVIAGRCDEYLSGEEIVGDCGEGLFFDERNMLKGGGVKDESWIVERKDLVEKEAVGDAAKVEGRAVGDVGVCKVLLKIVEAAFRGFEENGARAGGPETERERGTDRASCAGDEDGVTYKEGDCIRRRRRERRTCKKSMPIDGLVRRDHIGQYSDAVMADVAPAAAASLSPMKN